MKRSFQCAFGAAALLLSSSAWAQDFSAKGQLAISAERLFGFYHDSATLDIGLSGSQSAPLPGGATRSVDLNATEIGIQTGLVGYVDL